MCHSRKTTTDMPIMYDYTYVEYSPGWFVRGVLLALEVEGGGCMREGGGCMREGGGCMRGGSVFCVKGVWFCVCGMCLHGGVIQNRAAHAYVVFESVTPEWFWQGNCSA